MNFLIPRGISDILYKMIDWLVYKFNRVSLKNLYSADECMQPCWFKERFMVTFEEIDMLIFKKLDKINVSLRGADMIAIAKILPLNANGSRLPQWNELLH